MKQMRQVYKDQTEKLFNCSKLVHVFGKQASIDISCLHVPWFHANTLQHCVANQQFV